MSFQGSDRYGVKGGDSSEAYRPSAMDLHPEDRPIVSIKYIAVVGPLLNDPTIGLRTAAQAADQLLAYGLVPWLPQMSFFHNMFNPRPSADWMAYWFRMLERMDAVVRVLDDQPSVASDRMMEYAQQLGKRTFPNMARFFEEMGL